MRMARPRGTLRVAACLAVLSASVVFAAPARSQTPLEQAKALTGRATVEYNIGHFDQALELYSKAYESLAAAALLFDIGQCHRMLGHQERAVFFFQGYLRERPDAPNRALVEQLLQDLQRQLDAQRAATARAEEQQRVAERPFPPPPIEPVAPAPAPTAAPPKGHPALRLAGLATAGTGIALLGTSSLSNEITRVSTERGTWSPQYQSDYDAGRTFATAATILYVAGGVALATGGALTYLGWPRSGTEARPAAAVAPTPGGASLVVAGRF
jgi:tetratricopeptide (TPR) repeat protein